MEMIDRYIYAVTQKLPLAQRDDIAEELRGLIEDMLEERVQEKEITNHDIEAVLTELGDPRKLAHKYSGTNNYIIGPELFDSYMLILKIILSVTFVSITLSFVIQSILNPINILDHFIEFIVGIVIALPQVIGWTTLGFGLAEYFGKVKEKDLQSEWKPADLAPIPDEKKQIKRYEPIIGIIFSLLLLILFVFSQDYLGIWIFDDGFTGIVPFFHDETYHTSLLFLLLIVGLGITKESLKFVYGKWTNRLAIFTTIINALSVATIMVMVSRDTFWNPHFLQELIEIGLLTENSDAYNVFSTIWNQSTLWIFLLLIIGLIWELIDGLIKANRK
ncbi:hypothetical protein SH601_00835 [Gracilibacillus sp. S3-1-1]|uniref:Uncharacterized protein n=1 Tax=Gracilibacillus pellucidus TaxID=3095368 RepID=A0ACC6M0P1_9BACI|nr:hypothetical protein [Gracilibacillus sp. S3-1-1]MDX8044518.1 hypothetical protein [Gracilibacillus sp. S3-1-1]